MRLLPLAIVSLGAVGGYVAWRATSGQAAPEPMQSVQPLVVGGETTTAVAKPKPLELVVAADGSWSAVGESPVATEKCVLAAAKVEFLTLVAKRIVADAPQQNAANCKVYIIVSKSLKSLLCHVSIQMAHSTCM